MQSRQIRDQEDLFVACQFLHLIPDDRVDTVLDMSCRHDEERAFVIGVKSGDLHNLVERTLKACLLTDLMEFMRINWAGSVFGRAA